jgi:hypothetical protein
VSKTEEQELQIQQLSTISEVVKVKRWRNEHEGMRMKMEQMMSTALRWTPRCIPAFRSNQGGLLELVEHLQRP